MRKKKSLWSVLNPLEWLNAALSLLAAIFAPILRWFGMLSPPSTQGFENIRKEDVADEKKLAEQQEAAVDAIVRDMSPVEVVRAYARADAAGRATMYLSTLDLAQQDWLLGLSDEDLDKLAMSTAGGCARSLEAKEVRPAYPKAVAEIETAEILRIPTDEDIEGAKREFVSARFRELFFAPSVANANPRFESATRH